MGKLRVLPVHIIDWKDSKEKSVLIGEEFESLIKTFGGEIVDRLMQKVEKPDNATFIGKGKIEEIATLIKEKKIDVVVLNTTVKPTQVHHIKTILQKTEVAIDVWDRVDLILHIFDKHANTTEAKLQIELARMRYMGPRIYGMGFIMSRQGGGIGTRGVGETNTELMKRHWADAMKKVTDQLEKMQKTHEVQLDKRRQAGFKTVSIVGYTNAGKSSLFRLLTKKETLVENALFATLDSSVGKMYVPEIGKEILISDTIGFIRNLPPKLIDAFKSTLMESIHADIVLHVVDASDPEIETKIRVVNKILKELGRNLDDLVYVFNKIDLLDQEKLEELQREYRVYNPSFLSVAKSEGIDQIHKQIASVFLQGRTLL